MYRFTFSSIVKLRSLLARIGESTADLAKMLIGPELTIQDYCDSIRQQVDIARETELEKIHRASNALMVEVDAYERGCLSSWAKAKESTENVVKDVSKRMRAFLAEQQAYLQSVQERDDDFTLQLDEANKLTQELTDHKKELKAAMFDNKLASFYASPGSSEASLGELAFAHFQFPFKKLQFDSTELKPADVRSDDDDFVLPLDEGRRFVTFTQMRKEEHFTQMSCFDSTGRLICSKSLAPNVRKQDVSQCGRSEFVVCQYRDFSPTLCVYDLAFECLRDDVNFRNFRNICCNSKFVFGLWNADIYDCGDEDSIHACHLDTLSEAFDLCVPKKYKIQQIMADEHHVVAISSLKGSEPESRQLFMSIFDLATLLARRSAEATKTGIFR